MSKRILIFSTAYFPFIGGAEVAVKEITDRLSDFEFVMITSMLDSKLSPVEQVGNVEVHRLGKGNHWDKYRLIWQGANYASKLGHFDAVWGIMASYAGFAALRYKKGQNRPFLLTLQEGDSRFDIYKHVWWCWPYFKQVFKRADKIQAISNYLAQWAKDLGAKCVVEVVPNGLDEIMFSMSRKDFDFSNGMIPSRSGLYSLKLSTENLKEIEDINQVEGLQSGDALVVTVSRLVKKNGIEFLIKAMESLPDNFKLRIIGEGELRSKLEKLVKKLKLNQRVFFLGGVNNKDIWKYYIYSRRVFVRPSLSEGLGNVFLEAMHFQTPVIATPVDGIPDFLKDEETGWFCKVKNSKSIAEKIKYILDEKNKEEVQRVVENARKLVQEKYSWNLVAQKMKNIFDSLCAS